MSSRRPQEHIHDHLFTSDDRETLVNDDPVTEDRERVRKWVIEGGYRGETCPYCSTPLQLQNYEQGDPNAGSNTYADLARCANCGYWQFFLNQFFDGWFPSSVGWNAWMSKLYQFDEIPPEHASEIAQALRRQPSAWHKMDPVHLERFVADVYKANFSSAEVIHVGRPADGGVDVLFVDAGIKRLIQVKRREQPQRGEGVTSVRNLLGAMVVEDCLNGIVISTADHFTYRAYEAVGRAAERGMKVELVDRGKLARMLDPVLPKDPWRSVIREYDPDLYRRFLRYQRRRSEGSPAKKRVRGGNGLQLELFDEDENHDVKGTPRVPEARI